MVCSMSPPRTAGSGAEAIRRLADVLVCAVLLVVLVIPMLLIALAVRCEDRGPVLFRQERIGLRGTPFTLFKFRTMIQGSTTAHQNHARELVDSKAAGQARRPAGSPASALFLRPAAWTSCPR